MQVKEHLDHFKVFTVNISIQRVLGKGNQRKEGRMGGRKEQRKVMEAECAVYGEGEREQIGLPPARK